MNRSTWAARYRRLVRDAAFLFLSGPLSLLAFCLVLPLTVAGTGTVIIGVGLLLLVLALSIAGGFANLARLGVARLDEIAALALPTREIGFTGGEPFMNREILPMIETALAREAA